MKATEQDFPRVLLLSLGMKSSIVTIQMKATEQYFPGVLLLSLGMKS